MSDDTRQFMRRTFFVTGKLVTAENIDEVALWCEGQAVEGHHGRFVRVPVANAKNTRQTEARPGLWVLRFVYPDGGFNYKVYTTTWLEKDFTMVPDENGQVLPLEVPTTNVHPFPVQSTVKFSNKAN